jgi:hypothetical protein
MHREDKGTAMLPTRGENWWCIEENFRTKFIRVYKAM